jgi:dTDP-4-amino-4,6-dideoxygalactose transaminase
MPSFTFVSTANAFLLRGGVPVFVDIRADTLNIDERHVEAAITSRTRGLVPVHYAGVACDMDPILALADRRGLSVVEDAAQGFMSSYKGRALGSIGSLGALSFHQTKNVIAGEGGALIINDPALIARAEVIREKGTNRGQFLRGEVSEYTWTDIGSSFLPSELVAAILYAQLERAAVITKERRAIWRRYHDLLEETEQAGLIRRPFVPDGCEHNGHIYYVILRTGSPDRVRARLRDAGVESPSHYVPLHSSPVGRRVGRAAEDLPVTDDVARHLVRLPLWIGLTQAQQGRVVNCLREALTGR